MKSKSAVKTSPPKNFAVLIITHGRPDKVVTVGRLKKAGYTGPVYLVIDDEDKDADAYREKFGDAMVLSFSKKEVEKKFDLMDNFTNKSRNGAVWACNATFDIAKQIGVKYFLLLADDYLDFRYFYNTDLRFGYSKIKDLNAVLNAMLTFYKANPRILTLAMAQAGDFIGGEEGHPNILLKRKAMNVLLCSPDRRFEYPGRINEDTTAYSLYGMKGGLMFTTTQIGIQQVETQSSTGGMTPLYLEAGTYVKSFYSVMACPSCVKVTDMGTVNRRMHHTVNWGNTTPKILSEQWRK